MTDDTEIMLRAIISQNTSGRLVDAYAAVRQACDAAFLAGAKAMQEVVMQVVKDKRECFASVEYASPQPLGSVSERFACTECLASIAIIDPASLIEKAP